MKANKFHNQENVVCNHCNYNGNPVGVKNCQKCGKRLAKSRVSKFDSAYMFLAFIALVTLIFAGFGYYFGGQLRFLTGIGNTDSSSEKSASDIQDYDFMKDVPNVPKGTFNYGGAVLFASIAGSGAHQAMANAHPGFTLIYTEPTNGSPGNSRSLAMLLNGELSFAQIALPLTDSDYSEATKRGFTLEQVPVAIDAIVAFTHPGLSIPGISVDQLQGIYLGKITNWNQLGGPNLPIIAFARPKVATLLHVLLGPQVDQVSPNVHYVRDYTDAVRQVASTPGAISFGGSGPLVGQRSVRFLALAKAHSQNYVQPFINDGKQINETAFKDGNYPMIRRLYIAIRRDKKIDEQVGVAYTNMLLSKEGQQYVAKGGFLPLR
jgi:phosphate transport system substrate-binding protein